MAAMVVDVFAFQDRAQHGNLPLPLTPYRFLTGLYLNKNNITSVPPDIQVRELAGVCNKAESSRRLACGGGLG